MGIKNSANKSCPLYLKNNNRRNLYSRSDRPGSRAILQICFRRNGNVCEVSEGKEIVPRDTQRSRCFVCGRIVTISSSVRRDYIPGQVNKPIPLLIHNPVCSFPPGGLLRSEINSARVVVSSRNAFGYSLYDYIGTKRNSPLPKLEPCGTPFCRLQPGRWQVHEEF